MWISSYRLPTDDNIDKIAVAQPSIYDPLGLAQQAAGRKTHRNPGRDQSGVLEDEVGRKTKLALVKSSLDRWDRKYLEDVSGDSIKRIMDLMRQLDESDHEFVANLALMLLADQVESKATERTSGANIAGKAKPAHQRWRVIW